MNILKSFLGRNPSIKISTLIDLAMVKQNKFCYSFFLRTNFLCMPEESMKEMLKLNGRQFLTIIGGIKLMSIILSVKIYSAFVLRIKVNKDYPFVRYDPSLKLSLCFRIIRGISALQFLKPIMGSLKSDTFFVMS